MVTVSSLSTDGQTLSASSNTVSKRVGLMHIASIVRHWLKCFLSLSLPLKSSSKEFE